MAKKDRDMNSPVDIVLGIIGRIALDGIPALFRQNLPKPVQRLRIMAWTVIICSLICFFVADTPALAAYRTLLNAMAGCGLIIVIADLVAMTLVLKSRKDS